MFRKLIFTVVTVVNLASTASGQDSVAHRAFQFSDLTLQGGIFTRNNLHGTLNDFKLLAPVSEIGNRNFEDEGLHYLHDDFVIPVGASFSIMTAINRATNGSENTKGELRMGLTYMTGNSMKYRLYNETFVNFDTLMSANTSDVTYVDSVFVNGYTFLYRASEVRLEICYLYRLNPQARLCVYAGIGGTAGLILNATTRISHSYDSFIQQRASDNFPEPDDFPRYGFPQADETDIAYNETGGCYSLFTPVGLDFRFARYNDFWKHIHVFSELRPGVNFTAIPELRRYAYPDFRWTIGLRITRF